MYFLPFESNTRFVALRDTADVESYLSDWLLRERSWDDLYNDDFLVSNIVTGEPVLGVFFKRGESFITNAIGHPQIRFEGNPGSLLFIFGHYKIIDSNSSFFYEKIRESYIRQLISPQSIIPSDINLQEIRNELLSLRGEKLGKSDLAFIQNLIDNVNKNIAKLSKRNDPVSVIMPVIAAESASRKAVIQDILTQLNALQPSTATGTIDLTNYPTKAEMYNRLNVKTDKGYVDGLVASSASQTALNNHIFDPIHNPTYVQVGAPSRLEHDTLASRITTLESRVLTIEGLNPVRSIQTVGGILATNLGNGVWNIDSSGIGIGTGAKPDETSFYFGGPLVVALNSGGGWVAWEKVQILGIRATLHIAPTGGPVVLEFYKNAPGLPREPLYTTIANRPTFLEGEDNILAPLPDVVTINQNEEVTVDIVNVGAAISGADLSIQMRYQYVE